MGEDINQLEALVQDVSLRIGNDPRLTDSPLLYASDGSHI